MRERTTVRQRLLTAAGASALALSLACATDDTTRGAAEDQVATDTDAYGAGTAEGNTAPVAPGDIGTTAVLTDAEILGVVATVNQGEIQAAETAQERASSSAVEQYAQHMIHAHGEAQEKVAGVEGAEPDTNSELSRLLQDQGATEMSRLRELSGAEFDRAYAESQVKMHQQVLDTIDSTLLPQARTAEVRQLLQGLRPEIAEHLQQAQQIQSLSATAAGGAV
jgi:putative membrane protein